MNRSDVIGGSAVALTEALPFVAGIPRVYLVSDAIDTNGRFLLYTLASQVLSSASNNSNDKKKGRVLWLGCGPLTQEQILQGLRKIGCDRSVLATSTQANHKEPKSLTIRSLCVELSHKMLLQDDSHQDINKVFMKEMMQFVDQWLLLDNNSNNEMGTPWIILDDVSTLANLVGEQLVYQFILQLCAKSHAGGDGVTMSTSPGVILRCSNDQEDESLPVYSGASLKGHQAWFGAGGANNSTQQQQQAIHSEEPPWERSLVELADGVMDVLPLASGYTRELHGRIVLTEMPFGRGWKHNNKQQSDAAAIRNTHSKKAYPAMQIVNYCITDQNPKIVAYIM
ncbi:expressed unknown protein [Seminavis robusta]|uniref:Uncharacterized protein n=1 Tax=Seminavis robusta TaxID=568900 RepID=A0A9N8DW90_9STRA|nr:expressed unknown protein [Seminavis robusta]|eukprot:Sro294_g110180.1 n/a (339) ;mRNA; r:23365-24381